MLLSLANMATGTGSSYTCLLPWVIKAVQKLLVGQGLCPCIDRWGGPIWTVQDTWRMMSTFKHSAWMRPTLIQHGNTPYPKLLRFSP